MPLSTIHKVTTEITTYLTDYIDTKRVLEFDSIQKKEAANRVLKKINDFIRNKKPDDQLFP